MPRPSATTRARSLIAGLVIGFALSPPPQAQAATTTTELAIEAAFLVNFVRFTQWPPPRFESRDSPYVVSVAGSSEMAEAVRAIAQAAGTVQGRKIRVTRIASDSPASRQAMRGSHLVFVHESSKIDTRRLIASVRGASVLTVGDTAGFARDGGMLELMRQGSRVSFTANPDAIHEAGLVMSSKVLKLARNTRGGRR